MNLKEPPPIATWMLLHLAPGPSNKALRGDLLEGFRSGRSVAWYWHQVIAAVAIACIHELSNHGFLFCFAALWSVLAPAWNLLIDNIEHNSMLFGSMWSLAWPWSTGAALGLSLVIGSTFILAGEFLYLVLQGAITRSFSFRRIGRALGMSLCAFIAVSAVIFALPTLLHSSDNLTDRLSLVASITPSGPRYKAKPNIYYTYRFKQKLDKQSGKPVIVRSLVQMDANDFYSDSAQIAVAPSPLGEIRDTSIKAIVARIPYFVCLLCGLWGFSSRLDNCLKTIAV